MSAMNDEPDTPEYTPTGRWEVYSEWDTNYEAFAPVLVDPQGFVNERWEPNDMGQAQGYADTYNLNDDKAEDFRQCPYCENGCPWCD